MGVRVTGRTAATAPLGSGRIAGIVWAVLLLAVAGYPGEGTTPSGQPAELTTVFDPASRTVRLELGDFGVVLDGLRVDVGQQPTSAGMDRSALVVRSGDRVLWRVHAKGLVATVSVEKDVDKGAPLNVTARWRLDPEAMPAILKGRAGSDNKVVITRLGPAQVPTAGSLFDRGRDLALTAGPAGKARWTRGKGGWVLSATVSSQQPLSLTACPHYYRDTLGIKFYEPIKKLERWPTAPVFCMTWYGTHNQRLANLKPHIDWAAEHLLPYAGPSFVFQLDDCYAQKDDKAMREISDYIRSKGMLPGIWLAPFRVVPKNEEAGNPQWFLHDKDGKALDSFGGMCYSVNAPTINVGNAEAVEKWYGMWWRKASETWNFEYFKIDGQTGVVEAYQKAVDGGGIETYRHGLRIARGIVGPGKFINTCTGPMLDAVGLVDGSRTGGDTGSSGIAIDPILGSLYLNNVVWYSDPDAAARLYRSAVGRARVNALARALTGQQFSTDDIWTKVRPETCRVWQQSFPSLDIYPVNLYGMGGDHKVLDLRIAKPWGTWDVVAVCSYGGMSVNSVLDLGSLPLEVRQVHVFDYWDSSYLGSFPTDAKVPVPFEDVDARLFAVVPAAADDRPVLLSTSRHVSQGGLDLEQLSWKQDGQNWVATGRSSHLVKSDPYELTFFLGRHRASSAVSKGSKLAIRQIGRVARVTLKPAENGGADWQVIFEPETGPMLELIPTTVNLSLADAVELTVHNLGDLAVQWTAAAGEPHICLSAEKGELPAGAKAKILLSLDSRGLDLGAVPAGTVTVSVGGAPVGEVRAKMPQPENLALKAAATASSTWHPQFGPACVTDGDPETYWSGGASSDGWWLELTWPRPVWLDRIVLGEIPAWVGRVKSWKLLAGGERGAEVASGGAIGEELVTKLDKPVQATKLRVWFDKAKEPPTIAEVVVQNTRPGR